MTLILFYTILLEIEKRKKKKENDALIQGINTMQNSYCSRSEAFIIAEYTDSEIKDCQVKKCQIKE